MSGFKGTKGNWDIHESRSEGFCIISGGFGEEMMVVSGCIDEYDHLGSIRSIQDALLIASAPELLSSLQEMVAIVKKNTYPTPDKPSSNWGRMEAAEQVIAKALGEQA